VSAGVTVIIISVLRRRLRYVDKSSEQEPPELLLHLLLLQDYYYYYCLVGYYYIDKSSEQEVVNLTSFNSAGQPPSVSGLQLCASQQHQLLLVRTFTAHSPSIVPRGELGV